MNSKLPPLITKDFLRPRKAKRKESDQANKKGLNNEDSTKSSN